MHKGTLALIQLAETGSKIVSLHHRSGYFSTPFMTRTLFDEFTNQCITS